VSAIARELGLPVSRLSRSIARAEGAKDKADSSRFVNGVWLDKTSHFGRHKEEYSEAIFRRLSAADICGGKAGVYAAFRRLQQDLEAGLLDHLL